MTYLVIYASQTTSPLTGQTEEAEKHWKITLNLQPNDEKIIGFYSNFLEAIGRVQEANQLRSRIAGSQSNPGMS
jgi:hypothetical protein